MRVWLTKIGESVPLTAAVRKLRTAMLADALVQRGHEVVWWTGSFDHHLKKPLFTHGQRLEIQPGFVARTVSGIGYTSNVSVRRYIDHWLVSKRFRRLAESDLEATPDVVVAAMPDYHLAHEAVAYANSKRVPVVVDVRDQWPESFVELAPRALRPLVKFGLLRDYRKLTRLFARADGITSATTAWLLWATRMAGRLPTGADRVFFLGAPSPSPGSEPDPAKSHRIDEVAARARGRFVVSFVGTIGHVHNPLMIVRAARLLAKSIAPDSAPLFVIAGDGPFRRRLEEEAAGLSSVVFPGWLTNAEITALMKISSVGVVPFTSPTVVFPNKAFTYLSYGLPILASDGGDLSRLLQASGAGVHVPPNDADALASALKGLLVDPLAYSQMKAQAEKLFHERLTSERIYTDFAQHLETLARLHGTAADAASRTPVGVTQVSQR